MPFVVHKKELRFFLILMKTSRNRLEHVHIVVRRVNMVRRVRGNMTPDSPRTACYGLPWMIAPLCLHPEVIPCFSDINAFYLGALLARIPFTRIMFTLSRHPSRSSIALKRPSSWHPESSQTFSGRPTPVLISSLFDFFSNALWI